VQESVQEFFSRLPAARQRTRCAAAADVFTAAENIFAAVTISGAPIAAEARQRSLAALPRR